MPKRKTSKALKANSLLVELLAEELPPKSLKQLSEALAGGVFEGLRTQHFLTDGSQAEPLATPRRLAVRISAVLPVQPDRVVERKGPSVSAGLDPAGKPTPALMGFARSCGVAPDKLQKRADDNKGEYFLYQAKQNGEPLAKHLSAIVDNALKKLPVAKLMRWAAGDAQFVRPVHGIVLLHGSKVVPGTVLGLKSGNKTLGHRFLSKGTVTISSADDYEKILTARGKVVVSFARRREIVMGQLDNAAAKLGKNTLWRLGHAEELIDEVTSIVENPRVYAGEFETSFLELPRECLILSMQQHQRYFPIADARSKLLAKFLFVANVHPGDASQIVHGNERVLRARLSDAKFFYDQDRKTKLADRVPRLENVVYHNKLGNQLERVQRLEQLAGHIASALGADAVDARRAAYLSKADLLTDMVGEFPELQGIMGGYYARHDAEEEAVCEAIADQYVLRVNDLTNPANLASASLYLADRLEVLTGFFGVALAPTGDKDPFALRRAALGVLNVYRLLLATASLADRPPPDVRDLIAFASSLFKPGTLSASVVNDVYEFILDRYWHILVSEYYPKNSVEAVISQKPHLHEVSARLKAVEVFRKLPEADSLAAANKRIRNILRKSESLDGTLDEGLLQEPAERDLYQAVYDTEPRVATLIAGGDYAGVLRALASLRNVVDAFFDKVLVNAEDRRIRANRHALLKRLDGLMNQVADISKLAA